MYPSVFVALCSCPGACSPNGPGILLTSNMINEKVAHRLVSPVHMVPPPTNRPPIERPLHTFSHLPIRSNISTFCHRFPGILGTQGQFGLYPWGHQLMIRAW